MDEIEYKKLWGEIEAEASLKKKALAKQYVIANVKYKPGQIVLDHHGFFKIEKITMGYSLYGILPEIAYRGIRLTKKMEPMKKQENNTCYESNIKELVCE